MAACSRQVFAMARDERFPAYKLMRRVNPRTQTPVWATILVLVIGLILMVALPGDALLQLIIGGTILPALIYGGIVILYLVVRKRLEIKEGGFNLGRFELPIAIAALIWVAVAIFVLVTPGDARVPDVIVLGLISSGAIYFAKMMIFNREVLESEPSGGDAVHLDSEPTA
jgi:amino acid transporter